MPAIEFPSLAEHVRTLPAGSGRERQLQRIVDLQASREASSALHSAAARTREGVLGRVLAAADAVTVEGAGAAVAQARLRDVVTSSDFLALVPAWIRELRGIASVQPDNGACTVASALDLWTWTMKHFQTGEGARFSSAAQAIDELAEVLCPLIAARCAVLEVTSVDGRATLDELRRDLSHVYAAHASAQAGTACAELVFGYRRHLVWDAEGCAVCFDGDDLDDLEAIMPGLASGARMKSDVVEGDGSHASKRGPCASFSGLDAFIGLRTRLDGCLTGARLAKDRAAATIERSSLP